LSKVRLRPSTRRLAVTTSGIDPPHFFKRQNVIDDTGRWQASNLTEQQHGGALQIEALRMSCELHKSRAYAPLIVPARILNRDHRQARLPSSFEQLVGKE